MGQSAHRPQQSLPRDLGSDDTLYRCAYAGARRGHRGRCRGVAPNAERRRIDQRDRHRPYSFESIDKDWSLEKAHSWSNPMQDGSITAGPRGPPAIFETSASELFDRQHTPESDSTDSSDEKPAVAAFRAKYLGRLSYTKAWTPREQRPPQHQTVTIFDWDDTLLCTSFLEGKNPADVQPQLEQLANLAARLIAQAITKGHVFIVTNAIDGWVQHSAEKYMPEILPVLKSVRVISARSRFERQFPGRPEMWKVHALLEVQRQLDSNTIANLISVGDSSFEITAVHAMGREFSEAVVKTVKLWEKPSPDELRRQLEIVLRDFTRILEHPTSAKIGLERKRKHVEKENVPPGVRRATIAGNGSDASAEAGDKMPVMGAHH